MTNAPHEPDPDDAADDELAGERARESDDETTLAKVNDDPPAPDDSGTADGERTDEETVLARVNDNPPD